MIDLDEATRQFYAGEFPTADILPMIAELAAARTAIGVAVDVCDEVIAAYHCDVSKGVAKKIRGVLVSTGRGWEDD